MFKIKLFSMAIICLLSLIATAAPSAISSTVLAPTPKLPQNKNLTCVRILSSRTLPPYMTGAKNDFMEFRSNADYYWALAYRDSAKYFDKKLLSATGVILGDSHIGNIGDIRLPGRKTKITLIDLDDAGRGPFLLDFAKFLTGAKISLPDSSKLSQNLWDAYLAGLRGEFIEAPQIVTDALETDREDATERNDNYVERKTLNNKLLRGELELTSIPVDPANNKNLTAKKKQALLKIKNLAADAEEAFLKNYPQYKILDMAYKIKERGGSRGMMRFWVLADTPQGNKIFEMKELGAPAVSRYQAQLGSADRVQEVTEVLWQTKNPPLYSVVTTKSTSFWVRPKVKYDIVVDYNPKKMSNSDWEEFEEWTLYCAYIMGQMHGRQPEATKYRKLINEFGEEEILENLKDWSRYYREIP